MLAASEQRQCLPELVSEDDLPPGENPRFTSHRTNVAALGPHIAQLPTDPRESSRRAGAC